VYWLSRNPQEHPDALTILILRVCLFLQQHCFFFFKNNFLIFFYRFDVLILKINFKNKKIILIYFQAKNILKNICYSMIYIIKTLVDNGL
jgi:hypothetical protein